MEETLLMRLSSFKTCPIGLYCQAQPTRLAVAGFTYDFERQQTICNFCHLKKDVNFWKRGMDPLYIHKEESPSCDFILDVTTEQAPAGATAAGPTLRNELNNAINNDPLKRMASEKNRLLTYEKWPKNEIVSPGELAKAGFFFTGSLDRVQCAFCENVLRDWKRHDVPMFEHRRHFSRCRFVIGEDVGNIPITGQDTRLPENGVGGLNYHIRPLGSPACPEFRSIAARLHSFLWWGVDRPLTPATLCTAGFFYTGSRDETRCFHCEGGLWDWKRNDNPLKEHAYWFPQCSFIRNTMGHKFVEDIQKKRREEERKPDITEVINMGFSKEVVENAIREFLWKYGRDFSTVEELVDYIFYRQDYENTQRPLPPPVQSSDPEVMMLLEEQQKLKEERQCKICMDAERDTVFLPCGHFCTCYNCACAPLLKACAVCREGITSKQRVCLLSVKRNKDLNVGKSIAQRLREENKIRKMQNVCNVCSSKEVNMLFGPCYHLCCCKTCAQKVKHCPICNTFILSKKRIFV